ncbi:hypothetical protein [Pseudonocardia sp. ICBG1293]|uniref:hypothetical protein n=1 Tax=Pseudonocardia sp. ICBG1293 TaxID=2844382 RepID=UPI001CC91DFF
MVDWRLTIFGLMTLFVVYYLQDGIVGFLMSFVGKAGATCNPWPPAASRPLPSLIRRKAARAARPCCAWSRR